jgi:hypothetical protein
MAKAIWGPKKIIFDVHFDPLCQHHRQQNQSINQFFREEIMKDGGSIFSKQFSNRAKYLSNRLPHRFLDGGFPAPTFFAPLHLTDDAAPHPTADAPPTFSSGA